MKGGKDMTKTYTMYNKSDKYTINNGTEEIFEISKSTLSVDGKKLYDALFSNFEKGDNIKIDKDATTKRIDPVDSTLCGFKLAMYHEFGSSYQEGIDQFLESDW